MIALAYYLLKVAICSGILFFYYYVALRNKIFHQWNRFYLLLAVIISLIVPIVQITIMHRIEEQSSKAIQMLQVVQSPNDFLEEVIITTHHSITTAQWLLFGYLLVSTVLLFSLVFTLLKIVSLIKSHVVKLIGSIKFVNTKVPGTPFSFFRFIFWNDDIDLQSETGQQIFQHELVHVQEKHTWDKIFIQVVIIVFWCNPFFWLIRRELKLIHEFIADQKAVGQHGTEAFAAMILQSTYPQQFHSITNQFFQTSIKRRLSMLMKIQNPKISYISRVLVLPILAFIVLAFTIKTKTILTAHLDKPISVVIDAGHGMMENGNYNGARSGDVYEDNITLAIAKQIQKENSNSNIKIILTRNSNTNVDLKNRVAIAEENKADLFISLHLNAAPSNGTQEDVNQNGFSVMVSGKVVPYQKQNEALASVLISELSSLYKTDSKIQSRQIGTWILDKNVCPAVIVECGFITNSQDKEFITKEKNQKAVAEKILDGIEQFALAAGTGSVKGDVTPEVVTKNVIIRPTSTGDKPIVDKKSNSKSAQIVNVKNVATADQKKDGDTTKHPPLYIVNGKEFNGNLSGINANNIESINVLKDNSAIKKYGERAKYGVVEITLKKTVEKTPGTSERSEPIFSQTEVEASIDKTVWRQYLGSQLQKFIENAASKGMPPGQYTVNVRFLVEKNGDVKDVKALNDPGFGLGKAAADAVRKGPKWEPGLQNGKKINSYHTQPITFVMEEMKNH